MKVIIHAPSAAALARARARASGLLAHQDDATVRILASDDGAAEAVAAPDPVTDLWLILCATALAARGLEAPAGVETTPDAGYLAARLQRKGWLYLRA